MNMQIFIRGLEELSDKQRQEQLWLYGSGGLTSSFIEAVESVFDDSLLTFEMDRGVSSLPDNALALLRELSLRIDAVDQWADDRTIINSAAMDDVRDTAIRILNLIRMLKG